MRKSEVTVREMRQQLGKAEAAHLEQAQKVQQLVDDVQKAKATNGDMHKQTKTW